MALRPAAWVRPTRGQQRQDQAGDQQARTLIFAALHAAPLFI